jgi:hypothetical protein
MREDYDKTSLASRQPDSEVRHHPALAPPSRSPGSTFSRMRPVASPPSSSASSRRSSSAPSRSRGQRRFAASWLLCPRPGSLVSRSIVRLVRSSSPCWQSAGCRPPSRFLQARTMSSRALGFRRGCGGHLRVLGTATLKSDVAASPRLTSACGPTRFSLDVCYCAAVGRIGDFEQLHQADYWHGLARPRYSCETLLPTGVVQAAASPCRKRPKAVANVH